SRCERGYPPAGASRRYVRSLSAAHVERELPNHQAMIKINSGSLALRVAAIAVVVAGTVTTSQTAQARTASSSLSAADPQSMSARFYKDPNLPMNTLARSVAAAGIKRVTGDLVFDATAFDDRKVPEGWKAKNLGAAYSAKVSALSLNENLVWVVVAPSGKGA